jgi:hypothetical protein
MVGFEEEHEEGSNDRFFVLPVDDDLSSHSTIKVFF